MDLNKWIDIGIYSGGAAVVLWLIWPAISAIYRKLKPTPPTPGVSDTDPRPQFLAYLCEIQGYFATYADPAIKARTFPNVSAIASDLLLGKDYKTPDKPSEGASA